MTLAGQSPIPTKCFDSDNALSNKANRFNQPPKREPIAEVCLESSSPALRERTAEVVVECGQFIAAKTSGVATSSRNPSFSKFPAIASQ